MAEEARARACDSHGQSQPAGAPSTETGGPPAPGPSHAGAPTTETGGQHTPGPDQAGAPTAGDALEAALEQLGPFGLYQRYLLLMLCLPSALAAMYSLNYVFVADQVPFRCVVPECEGAAPAWGAGAAAALLPAQSCERHPPLPNLTEPSCDPADFAPHTIPCELLVYQNMDTTFAEFGLGCREWLRTLVGSVRNAALPFALLLTGYLSDRFGRRAAFCVFAACAGVLGIAKGCSVDYRMYLAFEFLEAALGYGFNSAAYVMMVEMALARQRVTFACATGAAYGLGGVAFAWLAWRVRYWRHLLFTIHTAALLLPLYALLVDESARWLHATGRHAAAAVVVRKAARWNKVVLDEEVMKKLERSAERAGESEGKSGRGLSAWCELGGSRVLLGRLVLCAACWASVAFVYYGLTINSVRMAGDKYVNFALNMAMEIVASLLIMMALERFGRKRSIFGAFLLCGVACVMPFFISHEGPRLGMFFLGKLAVTFAFNALYVFTAELFPTCARSSALAVCSLVGRLGAVLAPQTPLLSASTQAALYGACAGAAALCVLAVPETRRAALPAGVRDAERLSARACAVSAPPAPAALPLRVLSADT